MMSTPDTPFSQFQHLLREMFQFDSNDLDFRLQVDQSHDGIAMVMFTSHSRAKFPC